MKKRKEDSKNKRIVTGVSYTKLVRYLLKVSWAVIHFVGKEKIFF